MMRAFLSTRYAKHSLLSLVGVLLVASIAQANSDPFPRGPRPELTPGSVCTKGGTFRYPEHIRYCDRNVESALKHEIIRTYDLELGYSIRTMRRADFKIDHYIPLCAGGSNDESNLWPQHESVYKITDPLEPLVCEKMAAGKLTQAQAIELVREAKNNLLKADAIINHVDSL